MIESPLGYNNPQNTRFTLQKKFYLHKEKDEDRYCIIDFSRDDFIAVDNGENFLQIVENKLMALRFDTDYARYLSKHPAELQ